MNLNIPSSMNMSMNGIRTTSFTAFGGQRGSTVSSKSFARRVSTETREEKSRCKTLLPEDFVPTPYSVVCGRGRKCTAAVGNRRLQVIATMFIPKYSLCRRKEEKTEIVSQILTMVKSACPDERFAFVRFHNGRWWEVETLIAREKIGAVLRDCLHDKYRSSTKSKLERRRLQKLKGREEEDPVRRADFESDVVLSSSSTEVPSHPSAAKRVSTVSTSSFLIMDSGNGLEGIFS